MIATGEQMRTPCLAARRKRPAASCIGLACAEPALRIAPVRSMPKRSASSERLQIVARDAGRLARLDLGFERARAIGVAGEIERLRVAPAAADLFALHQAAEVVDRLHASAARRVRPCRGRSSATSSKSGVSISNCSSAVLAAVLPWSGGRRSTTRSFAPVPPEPIGEHRAGNAGADDDGVEALRVGAAPRQATRDARACRARPAGRCAGRASR